MARELKNPDMPTIAYKYDVRIIGDLPQAVWTTAKLMNRLWNEFVIFYEAALIAYPSDDPRKKELLKQLLHYGAGGGLYEWAKTYKGKMPNEYYWHVYETWMKAQKRHSKRQGGAPKWKHGLQRMLFPYPIGEGGSSIDWLHSGGRAHVRDVQGPTRGWFTIAGERLAFEIVMDRPLPEGALIKRVALSGFHERPFQWKWSLIVSLQIKPHAHSPKTSRVAGLDLGWRGMSDGIRIGMLTDSAGSRHELFLPYDLTRTQNKKFIERLRAQRQIDLPLSRDPRAIQQFQTKMDAQLEVCKIDLAGVDRSDWPPEARSIMAGIVKMRAGGLRKVRRALFDADISYEFLEDWNAQWDTDLRRLRAAQIDWIASRNYLYRCIAAWLADNYDVITWEGDLGLKQMAEEAGKRKKKRKEDHAQTGEWEERTVDQRIIEASQKHRQWASLHILRDYIREAMNKRGRELQDHPSAYSTQICDDCGQHVAPGFELIRECVDRHVEDQDVTAGLYYLRIAQDYLRDVITVPASVNNSQLVKAIRPVQLMSN